MPRALKTGTKRTKSTEESLSSAQPPQKRTFRPPLIIIGIILVFFFLGSLLYRYKSFFLVATVNNIPLFSPQLYAAMKNQVGKQVLDRLIVEELIRKEALKRKITVADSEIDAEIEKIKNNFTGGITLEAVLSQQGMTLNDLKKDVVLRLLAGKMVEENIQITDEEVDNYLKENKEFLKEQADLAKQKEEARNVLKDNKINEELQKLINDLKNQAKIQIFI